MVVLTWQAAAADLVLGARVFFLCLGVGLILIQGFYFIGLLFGFGLIVCKWAYNIQFFELGQANKIGPLQ